MSSNFRVCRVEDSNWLPASRKEAALHMSGDHLTVEMRTLHSGDSIAVRGSPNPREELAAVLEGRFELSLGDERYELGAGSGIIIPPHESYVWRVMSGKGLIYRVLGPVVT